MQDRFVSGIRSALGVDDDVGGSFAATLKSFPVEELLKNDRHA
jgi:hypothetical protein